MPSIHLDGASLRYPIYNVAARSLKVSMFRQLAGADILKADGSVWVQALDGVSLSMAAGDRIGLIGRNGSGKSTLLRLLAGIAHPQTGTCAVDGRVIPLLAQGLGVNPELSGYQNIALPMRLLGATSAEIEAAREEIAEWTELGSFMDLPVRTYSDGMRTRLMFAICTACHGDILLMDEWIGAGDQAFAEKANLRIARLLERSAIVVLATHSLPLVEMFCNRVIWMESGRVIADGPVDVVLQRYRDPQSHSDATAPQAAE